MIGYVTLIAKNHEFLHSVSYVVFLSEGHHDIHIYYKLEVSF